MHRSLDTPVNGRAMGAGVCNIRPASRHTGVRAMLARRGDDRRRLISGVKGNHTSKRWFNQSIRECVGVSRT
jgi:hypothetical protein